jgi:hypothetical protein
MMTQQVQMKAQPSDVVQSYQANAGTLLETVNVTQGKSGSTFSYLVNIDNGEATAETFIFSFNGENGVLGLLQGIVAPKAGVTITGNDGANSYKIFHQRAGAGLLLESIHMTALTSAGAASDVYFNQGNLKTVVAIDPSSNATVSNVPLSRLVTGADQNTNIRTYKFDKDFVAGILSGVQATIPAGQQVGFTFNYRIVGQGYLMGSPS